MRSIIFANHKGGSGKTTVAANLGVALAATGKRVLLVDLDSQQNLAESFGLWGWNDLGVEDVLLPPGKAVKDLVVDLDDVCAIPRLSLLPNRATLADDEFKASLRQQDSWAELLRNRLDECAEAFDYVLMDTAPGTSLATDMGLIAAEYVVVAAPPRVFEVTGAEKLYDKIGRYADGAPDEAPTVLGIALTHVNRTKVTRRAKAAIKNSDVMSAFATEIPHTTKVPDAVEKGRPITAAAPDGRVGRRFSDLAQELEGRICEIERLEQLAKQPTTTGA